MPIIVKGVPIILRQRVGGHLFRSSPCPITPRYTLETARVHRAEIWDSVAETANKSVRPILKHGYTVNRSARPHTVCWSIFHYVRCSDALVALGTSYKGYSSLGIRR